MRTIYGAEDYIDWDVSQHNNFLRVEIFNASSEPIFNVTVQCGYQRGFQSLAKIISTDLPHHQEIVVLLPIIISGSYTSTKPLEIWVWYVDTEGDLHYGEKTLFPRFPSPQAVMHNSIAAIFSAISSWPLLDMEEREYTLPDADVLQSRLNAFLTEYPQSFEANTEEGALCHACIDPLFVAAINPDDPSRLKVYYDPLSMPATFPHSLEKVLASPPPSTFKALEFRLGRLSVQLEDLVELVDGNSALIDDGMVELFTRNATDALSVCYSLHLPQSSKKLQHILAKLGNLFSNNISDLGTITAQLHALQITIAQELSSKV